MSTAFIGLGSNLGDREAHIHWGISQLRNYPDIQVMVTSSLYETPPWGKTDQPHFVNAVVQIETLLPAVSLLAALQSMERDAGRVHTETWGPRSLDMDVLCYDNLVVSSATLTLPHPHWHERLFVLVPWMEIAPNWVNAGQTDTVRRITQQQMAIQPSELWPEMLAYQIN